MLWMVFLAISAHVAAAGKYAAVWRDPKGSGKQRCEFIAMAKPFGPRYANVPRFHERRIVVSVSGSISSKRKWSV